MNGKLGRSAAMAFGATLALGACASGAESSTDDATAVEAIQLAESVADAASQPAADVEVTLPGGDTSALPRAEADSGEGSTAVDGASEAATPTTAVGGAVTDDGVLAAAVIIMSGGDLEGAIADGVVTEAEAEAALVAIETDTLDRYAG